MSILGAVRRRTVHAAVGMLAVLLLALGSVPVGAHEGSPAPLDGGLPGRAEVPCEALAADPAPAIAVTAPAGAPILLALCSDPGTGYRWAGPDIADPSVLIAASWTYQPPVDHAPGTPGRELFLLSALAPGMTTAGFATERPWAAGEPGPWQVTVTITVTEPVAPNPAPSAAVGRDAAAGGSCCAVFVENWGNPILVEGGGASHQIRSGSGTRIDASHPSEPRGEIRVTWMDREEARLEVRDVRTGYQVTWWDQRTGRPAMTRIFASVGEEAELWSAIGGHTVLARYVKGNGRHGSDHVLDIVVYE